MPGLYRARGRCRPRRAEPLRPEDERSRLLLFLARCLTPEQYRRARTVEDVEVLRFIAEGFGARA